MRLPIGDNEFWHVCPGIIISDRFLLTTNYCFKDYDDEWALFPYGTFSNVLNWEVVAGVQSVNTSIEDGPRYSIEKYSVYEPPTNYTKKKSLNYITLVKLNSSIKYSDRISPVCLPNVEQTFASNQECFAAGFQSVNGSYVLQQIAVGEFVNSSECETRYYDILKYRLDGESHICFGSGQQRSCNGDTGGPVACKVDGQYVLAGISSYIIHCGPNPVVPGAFINVAHFVGWIKENMKE